MDINAIFWWTLAIGIFVSERWAIIFVLLNILTVLCEKLK